MDFVEIGKKWQKFWKENQTYKVVEKKDKKSFYILDMFPYPSGAGLHVWHPKWYIATDVIARKHMLQWEMVLHPMGFDTFGLATEQFAIANKIKPQIAAEQNIVTYKKQLEMFGCTYDWDREVNTADPNYFKWTQKVFLDLYNSYFDEKTQSAKPITDLESKVENGQLNIPVWMTKEQFLDTQRLAYIDYKPINRCPSCKTWLANEDLNSDWTCERCSSKVEQKPMRQRVVRITKYAERLLDWLESLPEWIDSAKEQQRNWIWKSEWTQFKMEVITPSQVKKNGGEVDYIEVYTTRIDTVFGMSFVVMAPEHKLVESLKLKVESGDVQIKNWDKVQEYIEQAKHKTQLERTELQKEKTWVILDGVYAINPFNWEEIPVYIGDYVLANYWTGVVMAVPAHDERDFEFAKKYNLEIKQSITPTNRNCIVVHGSNSTEEKAKNPCRENERHWHPWLKKQLNDIWINTETPLFPKDWNPDYNEWKKEFEKNNIWPNTILVWHSAWCAFILRYLQEIKISVNKVILVAPAYIKSNRVSRLSKLYDFVLDKNLKNNIWSLSIFISDNDNKDIIDSANEIHKIIWWDLIELKWKWHFTESDLGSKEFKELLDQILNLDVAYTEKGILVNSGQFSGLTSDDAITKMQERLEEKQIWWKKINYRLQDRVFSRQRYRWEPIPMIHCENCGIVSLQESDLPLLLPDVENYEPTGTEEGPLANIEERINVECPKCWWKAKRESNTMPGWAGSSRYWIRYMDPHNDKELVSSEKEKFWHPVDIYVWGAEHITRHMIYARFWHKFLQDLWIVSVDEPFKKYQHVWLIMAEDGRKMSKRRWNVINPDDIINEFGADVLRMYEMFMWPFDQAVNRNTNGVKWIKKFLDKVISLRSKVGTWNLDDKNVINLLHKTIKKVSEDIDVFGFNTAISQLMIFVNELNTKEYISEDTFEKLTILLAPFAPHLAEELWSELWNQFSIFHQGVWPKCDEKYLVDDVLTIAVQVNWKVRWTIEISPDSTQEQVFALVKENEKISKYLDWEILKIIYIPWKICNIVVS
jgi:leucyl-tRNA synthetase